MHKQAFAFQFPPFGGIVAFNDVATADLARHFTLFREPSANKLIAAGGDAVVNQQARVYRHSSLLIPGGGSVDSVSVPNSSLAYGNTHFACNIPNGAGSLRPTMVFGNEPTVTVYQSSNADGTGSWNLYSTITASQAYCRSVIYVNCTESTLYILTSSNDAKSIMVLGVSSFPLASSITPSAEYIRSGAGLVCAGIGEVITTANNNVYLTDTRGTSNANGTTMPYIVTTLNSSLNVVSNVTVYTTVRLSYANAHVFHITARATNVYAAMTNGTEVLFSKSTNSGASFSATTNVASGYSTLRGVHIILSFGTLVIMFHEQAAGSVIQCAYSANDGASWTTLSTGRTWGGSGPMSVISGISSGVIVAHEKQDAGANNHGLSLISIT